MKGAAIELPPWAVVSPERAEHIARVAALVDAWARERGADPREAARWHRAAILHDALRDADPAALRAAAGHTGLPKPLWHGPAAAARAAELGEKDAGVLEAVRWHTVGSAQWDEVGKVLYLADYLEPARSHDPERASLAQRMPHDLDGVLRDVAARRISWLLRTGKPIARQTWEFWNGLVAGDSSSS